MRKLEQAAAQAAVRSVLLELSRQLDPYSRLRVEATGANGITVWARPELIQRLFRTVLAQLAAEPLVPADSWSQHDDLQIWFDWAGQRLYLASVGAVNNQTASRAVHRPE